MRVGVSVRTGGSIGGDAVMGMPPPLRGGVAQTPRAGAFPAPAAAAPSGTHVEKGRMLAGRLGLSPWDGAGTRVPEYKGRKEKLGAVGTWPASGEEKVEIPSGEKGRNRLRWHGVP